MKNKILMFCDDYMYQQIYEEYEFFDEDGNSSGSSLGIENFYINRYSDRRYINIAINKASGIRNVTHVIIQKSFYSNKELLLILSRFKLINPSVKIIIMMDNGCQNYEKLISEIIKNNYGYPIEKPIEIENLFVSDFDVSYDHLIIKKYNRKQKKDFEKK